MIEAATKDYLRVLNRSLQDIIQDDLIGLYLVGSIAQDDPAMESDIDVVGVVSRALTIEQRVELAQKLDHSCMSVPASGLDLLLVQLKSSRLPAPSPNHEFWFFTGEGLPTEIDADGTTDEHLITFAACREQGLSLFGPQAHELFSPVDNLLVIRALQNALTWHKQNLMDRFHDPRGVNSVLNACRAWCYVEEGNFVSKSAGGKWVLGREPNNGVVETALLDRQGKSVSESNRKEIMEFIDRIIGVCESRFS